MQTLVKHQFEPQYGSVNDVAMISMVANRRGWGQSANSRSWAADFRKTRKDLDTTPFPTSYRENQLDDKAMGAADEDLAVAATGDGAIVVFAAVRDEPRQGTGVIVAAES